jgi:hypothetical protein
MGTRQIGRRVSITRTAAAVNVNAVDLLESVSNAVHKRKKYKKVDIGAFRIELIGGGQEVASRRCVIRRRRTVKNLKNPGRVAMFGCESVYTSRCGPEVSQ